MGGDLVIHMLMQHNHDTASARIMEYIEQTTKVQRQLCRFISKTEEERLECGG
jgi:hypothetical protein